MANAPETSNNEPNPESEVSSLTGQLELIFELWPDDNDTSDSGAEDPDLSDNPSPVDIPEEIKSELWGLLQSLVSLFEPIPGSRDVMERMLQEMDESELDSMASVATTMFRRHVPDIVQLVQSNMSLSSAAAELSAAGSDTATSQADGRRGMLLKESYMIVMKNFLSGQPTGIKDMMRDVYKNCDRSLLRPFLEHLMRELKQHFSIDEDIDISLPACVVDLSLDAFEACFREPISAVSAGVSEPCAATSAQSQSQSVSSSSWENMWGVSSRFVDPMITDYITDDRLRELGVPLVLRKNRDFCLHLTTLLFLSSHYECNILNWSERIEVEKMLATQGLATLSDDQVPSNAILFRNIRHIRLFKNKLLPLGLKDYMDSVGRACGIGRKLRSLHLNTLCETYQMRWDNVLENIVESLALLRRRDQACPAWTTLAQEVFRILPELYGALCNDMDILSDLMYVRFNITPEQTRRLCKRHQFHCRYLDDELKNMAMYLLRRGCTHCVTQILANQFMKDDLELCEFTMSIFFRPVTNLSLWRFYRRCMENEKFDLADRLAKLRFAEIDDWKQGGEWMNLLDELTFVLRNCSGRSERTELNGNSKSVDSNYVLPALKAETDISSHDVPDFMEGIVRRISEVYEQNGTTRVSSTVHDNSCAEGELQGGKGRSTTISAGSLSASAEWLRSLTDEEWSVWNGEKNLERNQEHTRQFQFTETRHMTDPEFSCLCDQLTPVELELEDAITLIWTESGSEYQRKTNLLEGGIYHCLTCCYDPESGMWSLASDFCQVGQKMEVEEKGAFREPVSGRLGSQSFSEVSFPEELLSEESFSEESVSEESFTSEEERPAVFKFQRHLRSHVLSRYIRAVKMQAIACYYAQRFQAATNGRFGKVVMLNVSLVLVFDNSERKTIIDFMTAERNIGGSFDKFTNNWVWKNRQKNTEFLEAFSHFTYQDSGDLLMVTDLQGWVSSEDGLVFILTDPIIHCGVENLTIRTFSLYENRGIAGIKNFFKYVHPECNEICRFLKLRRHEKFDGWRWWRRMVKVPRHRKRNKILVSKPNITKVEFENTVRKNLKPVVRVKGSHESQEEWETVALDCDSSGSERQNKVRPTPVCRPKNTKVGPKKMKSVVDQNTSSQDASEWMTDFDSDSSLE